MKETAEIVRCKNCIYWDEDWEPTWPNIDNKIYNYCDIIDRSTDSDFFCAEGVEIINQEVFNKK